MHNTSAQIQHFFDETTSTFTYVVWDSETRKAAIIDPVLDYEPKSGRTTTTKADEVLAYVKDNKLHIDWIMETHIHADHLSAATYLQDQCGGKIAVGEHVCDVQKTFKPIFNAGEGFATDGRQFDHLFKDAEAFQIGNLNGSILHVPGHTPACIAYLIEGNCFVGDTLFMPDYGSARCDFPGGDAQQLYQSVKKLMSLPADTNLYMCHDYRPNGRDIKWRSTVDDQRHNNIHMNDKINEAEFVEMRNIRDQDLAMPALIIPSVQVNMRGGKLPEPENNGVRYLKTPLNTL